MLQKYFLVISLHDQASLKDNLLMLHNSRLNEGSVDILGTQPKIVKKKTHKRTQLDLEIDYHSIAKIILFQNMGLIQFEDGYFSKMFINSNT